MGKFIKGFMIATLLLLLAACGGNSKETGSQPKGGESNEPIKLSYAFFATDKDYPGVVAQTWADELEKRTNGKVDVEIYFSGTLLSAENMLEGVKNNAADIGLAALSYEPGRFPLVEISDLPSGYPNAEVASQVVSDLVQEFPPDALAEYEVLKVFTTEPMFITSKDPISSLEELKGQQLRIGGALVPLLERLGASPVGMSQADMAQALQTGIIDGYVSERSSLKDVGFAELVHHYTEQPLGVTTLVAVMNKDVYATLPDDVKQVMSELKGEMPAVAGKYLDDRIVDSVKWSEEEHGFKGVPLKAGEKEKWDKIASDLQQEYVKRVNEQGLPGNEYFNRMQELVQQYSK